MEPQQAAFPAGSGKAEDAGDGGRDFVGAVGDVDDRHGSGADEGFHSAHEGVAMGGVEALARFVEDEQGTKSKV